jgi:hypothetical protein
VEEEKSEDLKKAEAEKERMDLIKEKEKALILDLSKQDKSQSPEIKSSASQVGQTPRPVAMPKAPDSSLNVPTVGEKAKEEAPDAEFHPGKMAKARNMVPGSDDFLRLNKQLQGGAGKVRMVDIKQGQQRISGPLEEISSMTLSEFRRLSKSPKEAVAKIGNMFKLLEEEGFNKKMAGIKAWRQNTVNQLYLSIGQESLIEKKDIQKIIENRKANQKDYLSKDEFDAIMELNKKLRY